MRGSSPIGMLRCLRGLAAGTLLTACAIACARIAPAAAREQAGERVASRTSQIDWQTSPLDLDLRGMNGERYAFHCPPGKPLAHRVVGSGPYTDDSSICTAAVHAGVIRPKNGGDVTIEIRPGENRYEGSERNYITSTDYAGRWDGSFVIVHRETTGSQ